MVRTVDRAAFEQVTRQWVLPPCLHIPIVAKDRRAIEDHIGDVVSVVSPDKALLVRVDPPPPPDMRLPIFSHPNITNLFQELQLWVSPEYTRYRNAWKRSLGPATIEGKVLHHIYNRRMAKLREFEYIRIVSISRRANSSSAFTEQWALIYLSRSIFGGWGAAVCACNMPILAIFL